MRISDWSSDVCSSDLLTANAAECRALAKRFGILAVLRLEARLEIRPDPVLAGCYVVSGQVDAEVEQACVVSLEPVRQRIAETFVRSFAPAIAGAGTRNEGTGEAEADWLDPDAADPPDLLEDDRNEDGEVGRNSPRLNSSHQCARRMRA